METNKNSFSRSSSMEPRTYMILSVIMILGAWCALSFSGRVNPIYLPSPAAVAKAFVSLQEEGVLIPYTLVSLYRVLAGFLVAAVLAIPLGIIMATSRKAEAFFEPFIDFVRYLPVTALIPLMILYFGIGDFEKVAVIFVGTFFQLVLMVQDTVSTVPKELLHAAYTLGTKGRAVYTKVLLPASLPGIMDNLRICMGWAWTYLVVAELVAANSGLGFMILRSQRFLQTDRIFVGLLVIGGLGVVTDFAFKALSKALFPWWERLGS
ncbi:MAG: ABC transporter permease [Syntrophothermus sp.]|uniref:ABC transporter permease n=1 Tax=Syntrophothermus sp. TaxID=2736299 RepID=UPI002579FB5F|nr:ABC transporter permease [Syntrophothermus sp.]NSW82441.1 ABC transporter permease [Syntrophothermus sp.]